MAAESSLMLRVVHDSDVEVREMSTSMHQSTTRSWEHQVLKEDDIWCSYSREDAAHLEKSYRLFNLEKISLRR